MNTSWRRTENAISHDCIDTVTNKILVGNSEVFLKVGWYDGKPVFIDVTLADGRMRKHFSAETQKEVEDLTNQMKFARASIEIMCRQASALLQNGIWGLYEVSSSWSGTAVYHGGTSSTLECYCSSPMDAVARLIKQKKPEWEKMFGRK